MSDEGRRDVRQHGAAALDDHARPLAAHRLDVAHALEERDVVAVDVKDDPHAGRVRGDQTPRTVEGDDLAPVHDRDTVAQPLGLFHEMGDEHDGRAALADLMDEVPGHAPGGRVEAGGHLV